jgi:dTDP-4-dehydrorhamnose reductase
LRILLIGRNGQLGHELARALARGHELRTADRGELDLADPDAIRRAARDALPDVIVNAAAYTAVDQAESEPALAMRINAEAPAVLAEEAKRRGALLVHYSTDYVFDGEKGSPYVEDDAPNPLSAYGRSKLEGERRIVASGCRHLILRACWVYDSRGRNFLLTILRLARERDELRVVGDQVGSPTAARDLADASAKLLAMREPPEGLYHLAAAGQCSWFEFAREILALSGNSRARLTQITSAEYATAARRPRYSVLSCERIRRGCGIALAPWRETLARVLADVKSPPLRSEGNSG